MTESVRQTLRLVLDAALVAQYAALVSLVSPASVPRVVANDTVDDHFIAAAVTAGAE